MSNDIHLDIHQRALSLMPMMLNGTLDAAEQAKLRDHLDQCGHCREETELTERMMQALAEPITSPNTEAALARAHARIDAESSFFSGVQSKVNNALRTLTDHVPRWGLVLAGFGLVVLVVQTTNVDAPAYDVLSADSPASGLAFELTVNAAVSRASLEEHFAADDVTLEPLDDGKFRLYVVGGNSVERAQSILQHARRMPGVTSIMLANPEE